MKISIIKELYNSVRVSIRVTDGKNRVDEEVTTNTKKDKSDRESVIYDEARTVLEYQIETLNDIDDKAARTVRITALLVGGIFGAVSFGDRSTLIINEFTWWGSASLLLAVTLGMTTYSQSSPYFGPKPSDWTTILDKSDSEQDKVRLLVNEGYRGWINANSKINRINSYFLLLTQWSIATSLILFGIGLSHAFVDNQSFLPRSPSFVNFSHSLPLISFPLTSASLPVFVLFSFAIVTYGYSLIQKSQMP